MEPKEIFGTGQQPADNGTVSFEELESAFKTPTQRQDYFEKKPQDTGIPSSLADPDGSAAVDLAQPDPEPVSQEHAQRTGERIARLVDTGIDFALSNFVARNGESYRADERDLQDIADCWGELAQEKGWSIGPEWSLIILYVMVYGPLLKQAVTDRRLAVIEEKQQAMQLQLDAIQKKQEEEGKNQKPPTDGPEESDTSPFTHQPA